jgi:hypothetical protein
VTDENSVLYGTNYPSSTEVKKGLEPDDSDGLEKWSKTPHFPELPSNNNDFSFIQQDNSHSNNVPSSVLLGKGFFSSIYVWLFIIILRMNLL